MKTIFKTVVSIFLITVGCSSKKIKIDEDIIEKWSNSNFDLPVVNSGLLVFIRGESDSIGATNIYQLHEYYHNKYKLDNTNFKNYLLNVLYQRERLIDPRMEYFKCDPNILKNCQESFSYFSDFYTTGSNKKRVIRNEFVSDDVRRNTILYCFFINGYAISFDDYIGRYVLRKH